ncbi:MAG: ABC transporter ATP-binding protein/permease [Panacagrimonas sp.]
MKERSSEIAIAVPADAPPAGVGRQIGTMLRALRGSPVARTLLLLIVAIVVVILATSYGQIRLNSWNKPFFDALSRRDLREFLFQLGVFFVIAGILLVFNVAQRWLVETLKFRLREGLVEDLVGHWMMPRRAFWLARGGPMGVNPDQRMHDDAQKLCDLSADLGVGLFQATILLASFSSVLWVISSDFSIRVGDADYAVPGYMLWAAILYAGAGSLLSYWVGRSLIVRNADRYAREAELRFSLVRINEHLDGISLAAGEADERRRVQRYLADVLDATRRLVRGLTNLTWVTAGFGWTTTVAPILVAAPLYLTGKISFGGLMMAAAAFTQAQSSLRWFVDNFSTIADWRATLMRVASFREAVTLVEMPQLSESRISYAESERGTMHIDDLVVVSPTGTDRLGEQRIVVRSGERLLILGAPGTGKTLLFRALAGLWPWGSGTVALPKDESVSYMPRGTPYLPRGSLREVLAYPLKVDGFGEEAFAHALGRLGLGRLAPMLDLDRRWDRELSHDEQLSLAFARIVLQAPPWVLIDEAFGSLDDETMVRVIDIFTHELQGTSVIHIGRAGEARDVLFSRVVHLVKVASEPPPAGLEAADAPSGNNEAETGS